MMPQWQIWFLAIRPKTLILSCCPVLIGTFLAFKEHTFNGLTCLFTLLTALGIQIAANLANDYFDFVKGADTKARKGPIRVTQSGLMSLYSIRKATILAFALTAVSGSYLIWVGGAAIAFLVFLSLGLAFLYTAGPAPLAYVGLGDLFVVLFFGPVATAGTYYLQTHTLHSTALLAGLAPGFLSTAVLTLNNLRDVSEDRAAGKKTLIVRFGKTFGKAEYLFVVVAGSLTPLLLLGEHPFTALGFITLLPAYPLLTAVWKNDDPYLLNVLFQKTALLTLIYTLLFCIGLLMGT